MFRFAAVQHDWSSLRRRLMRRPGDVLVPAATLAIVIAVAASVLAVVNATMLRPLPFPDQERLVRVFTMSPCATEVRSRNPLASVDFVRFRWEGRDSAGRPLPAGLYLVRAEIGRVVLTRRLVLLP